jgi:hypothetical protein
MDAGGDGVGVHDVVSDVSSRVAGSSEGLCTLTTLAPRVEGQAKVFFPLLKFPCSKT